MYVYIRIYGEQKLNVSFINRKVGEEEAHLMANTRRSTGALINYNTIILYIYTL